MNNRPTLNIGLHNALTDDIIILMETHQRRLHQLTLQAARFGYSTPPHVLMEIDDLTAEIAHLKQEIADLPVDAQQNSSDTRMATERTMSSSLPDFQRKALTQRRSDLLEEYHAITAQLGRTLSDADQLKLSVNFSTTERSSTLNS